MDFESALAVIERAATIPELAAVITECRDAAGLAHLVYHATEVPACEKPNPLLLLTYNDAWVKRYVGQDYFQIDPVVIAGRAGFLPIDWINVPRATAVARHFFAEAESHGVGRHGFTMPLRGPSGERALFTINANATDEHWYRWRHAYLRDFSLLAHYLHDRAMELASLRPAQAMRPLSRRELQCLQLIAQGLSPQRISGGLRISESAVRLYLRGACRKLGCSTLSQAVAKATLLDLIGRHEIN